MAKPRPKSSPPFRGTIVLAVLALVLFLAGEVLILTRTDAGRITVARTFHVGDDARLTQLVGRQIRRALDAAGVPRDSVRESVLDGPGPRVRWRVGLRPHASLLQANYAVTRTLESQGAAVLSGREETGPRGETIVTLLAGLPRRPTHEIVIVRHRVEPAPAAAPSGGRLAIVVYGFGDDAKEARSFVDLPAPFAIALPPAQPWSGATFRAARTRDREIVLHLPLEPLNYPTVSPGPGTILVTMRSAQITSTVHRYLDQAGSVVAVTNLMGSLATQDMTVMTAVYRELRQRHLTFVQMSPAAGSVCKSLAADFGVAYDEPDAVIDAEARARTPKAIEARWKQVLEETRRRGQFIVMLRATELSRAWLPGAIEPGRLGGVEVVPLTALLRRPVAL